MLRRKKVSAIGFIIGLVIVGFSMVIGKDMYKSAQPDPTWVRTVGVVSEVAINERSGKSDMYAPKVSYVVDGNTYTVTSRISSSAYPRLGASKNVAYNPSQPRQAQVIEPWSALLIPALFPLIGATLVLISIFSAIYSVRRTRKINFLKEHGVAYQGVVSDITSLGERNNIKVHRITITAQSTQGEIMSYISDTVVGAHDLYLLQSKEIHVPATVFVNPDNPKDYYVDIEALAVNVQEKMKEFFSK